MCSLRSSLQVKVTLGKLGRTLEALPVQDTDRASAQDDQGSAFSLKADPGAIPPFFLGSIEGSVGATENGAAVVAQRCDAQGGNGIEVRQALEMTGLFDLVAERVSDLDNSALNAAPQLERLA
jgi:hypothetical protein